MLKPLCLVCQPGNDLCAVLEGCDIPSARYSSALEAIDAALPGSGVLIMADGYPETMTSVSPMLLQLALEKGARVFVEYPSALPGLAPGEPRTIQWERAVVCSDAFLPELDAMRILTIHDCRLVSAKAPQAYIVLARVAGFDHAVYGLPSETWPVLFEHSVGNLLVSTTKLSQFVSARYAPRDAWVAVWKWILGWLCPGESIPDLLWKPSVRPVHSRAAILAPDAEARAFDQGTQWFTKARLFIHPSWRDEAKHRLYTYHDGTGPGPSRDWPVGDGCCGMIEGASSKVHLDGTQDWRYSVRNDCMGEVSMAMAFASVLADDPGAKAIAENLNDYIYVHSSFAAGPRADPSSPSYGLVSWASNPPADGIYYGDDNARSMLGTLAAAALLGETRWDKPVLRCLLANLRTTGPLGFRGGRLDEEMLQEKGWEHFWQTERVNYAAHYESWKWACFLWAYRHTGFAPFLDRARTAIRMMMDVYPDQWRWTNGMQQERARMLLPLTWLVRVDDCDLHRSWLRAMTEELLALQDECGAIREEVGSPGLGSYGPPASNEAYGTSEAPLIQQNGDPLCDLLYTTNFAYVGLHEAHAATGEAFYAKAADRLTEFLCRIQVHSEAHPEFDGAWFRAFDFGRWEYWASNADVGWGAWSIESGWTQAWIASVLAMRQTQTSLWDLTAASCIGEHLDSLLPQFLPECSNITSDD